MKKLSLFCLTMVAAIGAMAQTTFQSDGLTFTVISADDKTVAVDTYNGGGNTSANSNYTGAVTIPSTVTNDGVTYTVTQIGKDAFNYSNITSVTIPATVQTIGSYTIESAAITLPQPTREGYTFAGWTGTALDGPAVEVSIAAGSTGNRTYTATWTPIIYNITYTLNGGTVEGNPATYTIESETFTLAAPERAGYTFEGWTGTGLEQAAKTVTIAKGSTGNRQYTATWKENVPEPGPEPTLAQGVLTVTRLADMKTGRISHQILPTDDGFAVFGGHVNGFSLTRTAERYSSKTGEWTTMKMLYNHDYAGSIVMPDGKLLLMAGMSSGSGVGSSTNSELYDPATNDFTATGNLVQSRNMCKAVMSKSGKVYVNGNWYNSNYALECYDPETQRFSKVGDGINTYKPLLLAMRDERIVILGGTKSVIVENGTTTDIGDELLNSCTILKGWDETQMKDYELADYSYVAVGKSNNQAMLLNIYDDATEGIKVKKIADLPMSLPEDATAGIDYGGEQTRVFAKPAENRILVQSTAAADGKRPVIVEYTYTKADKLEGGSTMVYATKEQLDMPVNQGAWATLPDGSIVSTGGGVNNFTAPANTYLYRLEGVGIYCDVNGDGTVDVADIASIISVMAGSADTLKASADVNGDGTVDVADIATVISRMAELARLQLSIED